MFTRLFRLLNKPLSTSSPVQKKPSHLVFQYSYPSSTAIKQQQASTDANANQVADNDKEVKGKIIRK